MKIHVVILLVLLLNLNVYLSGNNFLMLVTWNLLYEIKLRLTSTRLVGNETTEIVGRASLAYVIANGDIAAFISHRDALFHSLATRHHCPSTSRADHGFSLALCRCCRNGVLAFCQNVRIVFTISDEFDRRTTRAVCCLNLAFFTCNKVITMVCLILTEYI